jgi:hypothetical protein
MSTRKGGQGDEGNRGISFGLMPPIRISWHEPFIDSALIGRCCAYGNLNPVCCGMSFFSFAARLP